MLLLPTKITISEARDAQRLLAQGLQSAPEGDVVINASGLQQFDTSALAVLLECQRLAQAFGKRFEVRDAPPKLTALAKLYGVDALLFGAPAATNSGPLRGRRRPVRARFQRHTATRLRVPSAGRHPGADGRLGG